MTARRQSGKSPIGQGTRTPQKLRRLQIAQDNIVFLYTFKWPCSLLVVLIICLVTDLIDWKQKIKNQKVQIEINRVQPGLNPCNFLQLVSFPFQYTSDTALSYSTVYPNSCDLGTAHANWPLAITACRPAVRPSALGHKKS